MTDTPQGWAHLLADKGPKLASYFLRRVAHRWDAQDLVQEVYLRLLRSSGTQNEPVRNPEAYLFTVAANLVKEHAQLRQRAPVTGEDIDEVIERLATPCEAGADVDRELRRRRLADVIGRLSPKCRAVLVMHYRDDMPYRDIAEALGVSTNMVKKYIVKGLAACRQGMQHYE
ncbi:RNA polymerase sigma factor [Luteibacter anthropi]|uniref:RNA polymerase sigma factor n=1 Tax=Luteibacter anthropi TaxID=564369 RepID=A0A7X5UAL6_9GAMM|nr:RNA polymerase sigma factor [Luteibacter anthropi]NII06812.1 RNA polymerase sigma factor [Luteibacter anthropi]URX61514.1 RNA polymerase sigma factor [Luteibacter anthropi]